MSARPSPVGCQALSPKGRRCGSKIRVVAVHYHGHSELYGYDGPEPTWVSVYLCAKHRPKRTKRA